MNAKEIAQQLLSYSLDKVSDGIAELVTKHPELNSNQLADGLLLMRLHIMVGGVL